MLKHRPADTPYGPAYDVSPILDEFDKNRDETKELVKKYHSQALDIERDPSQPQTVCKNDLSDLFPAMDDQISKLKKRRQDLRQWSW